MPNESQQNSSSVPYNRKERLTESFAQGIAGHHHRGQNRLEKFRGFSLSHTSHPHTFRWPELVYCSHLTKEAWRV